VARRHGGYRDESDVYALVHAVDWKRLFLPTRTLRVDVAATRSPLQSLEFATLRVKDAVCDRLRADLNVRPSIDKRAPDVRVHAYLTDRDATIYVDTSGDPLFKRGYRRDAEEAPLRENLAAGLLALSAWTPERHCWTDVRQRHDRRGGSADSGEPRARPDAHVRLPEAAAVRRSGVAAHQAVGTRPHSCGACHAHDLRKRSGSGRRREDAKQPERRAGRRFRCRRVRRPPRARRTGGLGHPARESALWVAWRTSRRWRRSIRCWAMH
jgi:hypothetical protein